MAVEHVPRRHGGEAAEQLLAAADAGGPEAEEVVAAAAAAEQAEEAAGRPPKHVFVSLSGVVFAVAPGAVPMAPLPPAAAAAHEALAAQS